ncbi:acetyl-CoA carboxylase biotin carboxyl carrier protein [Helicobacter muridarum]|uniref:Biotin carboxyl carrier protein of acetyl-CoA carboxylase n=1 Tax=Helicobacter muridarum TaxID=216 RepID=A0A099TV38_9HELI|nr:acetyl-CoA carboxylase biotin carboxyl carrier protein [Helicobacter muridarum]TLD98664.1 acetyl-CoA carboxylase biotin carboxyl carrier protein [Helicobacter muridarum]STQ86381.1 biotin carboxyl carrier protein [Helicobacter muridarum]
MNVSEIKEIIQLFNDSKLESLKLQQDNFSLKLNKNKKIKNQAQTTQIQEIQAIPIQPVNQTTQETKITQESLLSPTNKNAEFITAPMVGTFYRSPSPGAAPYVSIGDTIKKGQTIGIIEAMKIMNEIEAEFDCKIIEIEVNDAQPVEFGTKLVMVEKI